jgi:predicted lipoprotein with Yx(FWY)xxD motif
MEDIVTRRNRRGIATVCGLAAALALAACSGQGNTTAQAEPSPAAADGTQAPNTGIDPNAGGSTNGETTADSAPSGSKATLIAKNVPKMGKVVTDGQGWTLYRFDKDTKGAKKSACEQEPCLSAWPAALVAEGTTPTLEGIDQSLVSTFKRSDGGTQLAIDGWPLYRFAKDGEAGKWRGQGNGNVWFVIQPNGKKNLSCLPTGQPAQPPANGGGNAGGGNNSGGGTGGY